MSGTENEAAGGSGGGAARCGTRGGARGRPLPGGFVPFHTPVRGYRYAARPPGAAHPDPGQRVGLIRERQHPADGWAVGVWLRAGDGTPWRIGYLERAVAARLGPELDRGQRLRAEMAGWAPEPYGRWRRPVILIEPDANCPVSGRTRPRRSAAAAMARAG